MRTYILTYISQLLTLVPDLLLWKAGKGKTNEETEAAKAGAAAGLRRNPRVSPQHAVRRSQGYRLEHPYPAYDNGTGPTGFDKT